MLSGLSFFIFFLSSCYILDWQTDLTTRQRNPQMHLKSTSLIRLSYMFSILLYLGNGKRVGSLIDGRERQWKQFSPSTEAAHGYLVQVFEMQ